MNIIELKSEPAERHDNLGMSRFWGFPVMPESFDYPSYKDEDGEEAQYDFICQLDCAELAQYDKDEVLPHQGVLYFFARIGAYAGNFWEEAVEPGIWGKEAVKVVYTPRTDFGNFVEMALTDEEDNEICYPLHKIDFSEGIHRELLHPVDLRSLSSVHSLFAADLTDPRVDLQKNLPLLVLNSCRISDDVVLDFPGHGHLTFLVPRADLTGTKRTFKNAFAVL